MTCSKMGLYDSFDDKIYPCVGYEHLVGSCSFKNKLNKLYFIKYRLNLNDLLIF